MATSILIGLGSALAYWIEADDNIIMQQSPSANSSKGMMTRDEVVEYYLKKRALRLITGPFMKCLDYFV